MPKSKRADPGYEARPEKVQLVSMEILDEHPDNPRTLFDDDSLAELTESVRQVGILNPLQVAQVLQANGTHRFRILAGHRRFRAARAAGLKAVPCIQQFVVPHKHPEPDAEEIALMITEQLQHAGWHPLEEAWAFKLLMERASAEVGYIAGQIGKSEDHVYQRLQLLNLKPTLQSIWIRAHRGDVPATSALLVARLPESVQERAYYAAVGRTFSDFKKWLDSEALRPKAEKQKAEKAKKAPEGLGTPGGPPAPETPLEPSGNVSRPNALEPAEESRVGPAPEPVSELDASEYFADVRAAELKGAWLKGVEWALSNIGWHPDKATAFYDRVCEALGHEGPIDDLPICRAEPFEDRGDSSVGMDGYSGVGLSEDQSGTLIELLLAEIEILRSLQPEPKPEPVGEPNETSPVVTTTAHKLEVVEGGKEPEPVIIEAEFKPEAAVDPDFFEEGSAPAYDATQDPDSPFYEGPKSEPKDHGNSPVLMAAGVEILEHHRKAVQKGGVDYDRFRLRRLRDGAECMQSMKSEELPATEAELHKMIADSVPIISAWAPGENPVVETPKPKYLIWIGDKPQTSVRVEARDAEEVQLKGWETLRFLCHRCPNRDTWSISEYESGLSISTLQSTKAKALSEARKNLKGKTLDEVKAIIALSVARYGGRANGGAA